MARKFANVLVSIWGNPDVRALPPLQQWLYLQLWTHPGLNYAGVMDWRPATKVAPLSYGSTGEFIESLIPLLVERRFVVVDKEELFLRSYFRHDGLLDQRTLPVSMVNAYSEIGSNVIRGAIITELLKLKAEFPEKAVWSIPAVTGILKHPTVYPPIDPRVYPAADPQSSPLTDPNSDPDVSPHLTDTATTTDTEASLLDFGEAKLKETRLPKDWVPTSAHYALAKDKRIDILKESEAFRLHAETHDRHAARWNAAFTTWLKKAKPSQTVSVQDEWRYNR